MDLSDRVALVTGAAGGIGKTTVDQVIAAGARVVAVDIASNLLEELWADRESVWTAACDVSNPREVDALFSAGSPAAGRIAGSIGAFSSYNPPTTEESQEFWPATYLSNRQDLRPSRLRFLDQPGNLPSPLDGIPLLPV